MENLRDKLNDIFAACSMIDINNKMIKNYSHDNQHLSQMISYIVKTNNDVKDFIMSKLEPNHPIGEFEIVDTKYEYKTAEWRIGIKYIPSDSNEIFWTEWFRL